MTGPLILPDQQKLSQHNFPNSKHFFFVKWKFVLNSCDIPPFQFGRGKKLLYQVHCKILLWSGLRLKCENCGIVFNGEFLGDWLLSGGVRTLIALHHGRKTKSESFASCRGRVNISCGSEIAWINVECNGDSLSVTVPSKVKKCYSSVTNSLLGGNWRNSQRIKTAALPKNLFIW